jgi:hypothetical protein
MNKTLIIALILLFFSQKSFSQKIDLEGNILYYQVTQSGNRLDWKELLMITETNLSAYELIKKSKSQNNWATIMSFTSGALFGVSIITALSEDHNTNWAYGYIGGGLLITSVSLVIKIKKNLEKGIDTYNSSLNSLTFLKSKTELNFVANNNGIGLALRF